MEIIRKKTSERIRMKLASTVMDHEVSRAEPAGAQVVDGVGEVTIRLHLNDEPDAKIHLCEQKTLEIVPPPDKMYEITEVELAEILVDNGVAEVSVDVYYNKNFDDTSESSDSPYKDYVGLFVT